MLETPCRKAYVSVNLDVDEEGTIRPRFIRWRNGRIFEIDELRYCGHNSIAVFEDTRGHVQAKCKACGRETVFDVLSMRRLKLRLKGRR